MRARSSSAPPWASFAWRPAAHFFTDVVFAGVLTYLLIWTFHGLIYRWRPTRLTDEMVERPLEQVGTAFRDAIAAVLRLAGYTRKRNY